MNVSDIVTRAAHAQPDHPALIFEERGLSYAELADRTRRVAGLLARRGVRQGDRVGLLLPNVPAFVVVLHGVLRLGAIAVPIHPKLTRREMAHVLADAGVTALVTLEALHDALDPELVGALSDVTVLDELAETLPGDTAPALDLDPHTPAVIIYSSGTTGQPKGVTLSHQNIATNIATNAMECGIRAEDRLILFMPLSHCYGLNVILNSGFHARATVVMERRFDPDRTPATLAREQVSMFFGVPTTFIVLLQRPSLEELTSLRYCYCAAAPLPLEVEARWRERTGLIVNQAYGLSEASPCVAYNHVTDYRPGRVGVPSEGVQVRLVDPVTGADVDEGAVGELWVKGPGVMLGYWGRPEATAQTIVDGWLRTGDLGRRDPDGYLSITDRLKDLVICGGMNVYPTEVEEVLYQHPDVAEAAVVGAPHETMGEVVWAYVAPVAGQRIDPRALRAFLKESLAEFKLPTAIVVRDHLPKGRTGKILRRVLREEARQDAAPPPVRQPSHAELRDWIIGWLRQELDLPEGHRLGQDTPFAEVGVDSLMAVRVAEALSERLGRRIPALVTWLYATPEQLAASLAAAPNADHPAEPSAQERHVRALSEAEVAAELEAELASLGL